MKPFNLIYNPLHPDPNRLKTVVSHLFERSGMTVQEWSRSVDVYPCIQRSEVIESINASHKMIVRMAKEAGISEVCIFEDDAFFPATDGFQYWLRKKPKLYDLYLAGTYGAKKDGWDEMPYCYVETPVGFHAYFVHSRYYDNFLAADPTKHIDTAQEGKGHFKVCYPYAAIQRPGWSANLRKTVNYNRSLQPEDIYTGTDPEFFTTFPD